MRLFHWTQAKSIFVSELDAEHRNLYQLAEEVRAAVAAGALPADFTPTVRALLAAAEEHFLHEERMMQRAHYPLLKWHKRQHDTVRARASEFLTRIEAGEAEAATSMLDFLADWLHDHMAVTDRMMAAALRAYARLHAAA